MACREMEEEKMPDAIRLNGRRPAWQAGELPRKKNGNAVRRCRWDEAYGGMGRIGQIGQMGQMSAITLLFCRWSRNECRQGEECKDSYFLRVSEIC